MSCLNKGYQVAKISCVFSHLYLWLCCIILNSKDRVLLPYTLQQDINGAFMLSENLPFFVLIRCLGDRYSCFLSIDQFYIVNEQDIFPFLALSNW